MYLGLDSSTQSLSALLIDPASGRIVGETSANFGQTFPQYHSPSGFIPGAPDGEVHADPRMWLDALDLVLEKLSQTHDLSQVRAIACSGQQHGSVYLDNTFADRLRRLNPAESLAAQIAPALTRATAPIWMDTSTSAQCAEITARLGGPQEVCRRSGSVAVERFTGPQIRRFFQFDPSAYGRTAFIHLVSSFIGSVLAGASIPIDHGDAAGMNLLNLQTLDWDDALLEATAPDLRSKLPATAPSATLAGPVSPYFSRRYGFSPACQVALSTGDNPSSLVGMGATTPGTAVISLGTSDTFFAAMSRPVTDPNGYGHVFANPAGGFMSLICFRNGSLARENLRDRLGLDWSAFDSSGLAATPPGNEGRLMLPFFGPEITPRHDFSQPILNFPESDSPAYQVRALLEGQFLNMRLHSRWIGQQVTLIRLTGGASQSDGIAQLIADIFQAPVERFAVSNGAGLGAALRAAHACGESLDTLQAAFCRPAPDSRLEPDSSLAPTYDSALAAWQSFLHSRLG